MNGSWQIFVSETRPDTLGNGVRFYYNPTSNKLFYRNPADGSWTEVPDIDLSIYLTKDEAAATYLTESSASLIYLTISDADTIYLTKADASSTYALASSLDEYLTESNAINTYLSQTDAASIYATIDSPTFTGSVSLPQDTTIGSITSEEIQSLSGISDNIQEQLDKKIENTVVSSSSDISLDDGNILYADTINGSIVVTLPANPVPGNRVMIVDIQNSFKRYPAQIQTPASGSVGNQTYVVTNEGSGAYIINDQSNPTLNLVRGQTYNFQINASGHPFYIQETTGGYDQDSVYSTGIEGNGTQAGTLVWAVDSLAPDTLYYQCEFHANMAGQINITSQSEEDSGDTTPIEGNGDTLYLDVNGSTVVLMYINDIIGWKVV
jgi:hypothetical protein